MDAADAEPEPPRTCQATTSAPTAPVKQPPNPQDRTPLAHVSSGPPSSLATEIALVDAARAGLGRGDAAGAEKLLDEYAAQYAQGALAQEAQVLRIEAAATEGNRADAVNLRDAFLSAHPDSPYAALLHQLLDE